jgi:hypothetical protein
MELTDLALFTAFAQSIAPIQTAVTRIALTEKVTELPPIRDRLIVSLLEFQLTESLAQSILTASEDSGEIPGAPPTINRAALLRDAGAQLSQIPPCGLNYALIPLLESRASAALGRDDFAEIFAYLWCAAFCFFRTADLALGPIPGFQALLERDGNLCESVGFFVEDLQPLRESAQRLLSRFADFLADAPPAQCCPLGPAESTLYADLILAARLDGVGLVEGKAQAFLEKCFSASGSLDLDFLKEVSEFEGVAER